MTTKTLLLMQAALDLWNKGLSMTGSALVPKNQFGTQLNLNGEVEDGTMHPREWKLSH